MPASQSNIPCHATTPLGRADLDAVGRSGSREDGDTKTENEAATNKLGLVFGGCDDSRAQADDERANYHTLPAA